MTTTDRPPDDRVPADPAPPVRRPVVGTRREEPASIGEVVDLVKTYATQETLGPLKGAGRWLALGAAGAMLLGLGLVVVLLGVLRLVQTEWERSATGAWSWLAYLIVLIITVVLLFLVLSRINRDRLNKE